jgi:hypothetical protein
LTSILDLPLLGSTRKNHALEHATLHILEARYPNRPLAGHSNPTGFFILGDVPAEAVADASMEAMRRLRAGESGLAIHPGCGTNLATSALAGATLGWLIMRGARSTTGRLMRLPVALMMAVLGVIVSRPLGPVLQQRITTDANIGALHVTDVRHSLRGPLNAHRVLTAG